MDCSSWINTSLDLNINSHRFHEDVQSTYELEMELKRVSAENKKLVEMLTVVCENYNSLRSQLMEYMSKYPEKDLSPSSKKRKSESSNNNNNNNLVEVNIGNSESSSTDEESSWKKPREEETIKAKISRVYVRTEASDTTSLIVKDGYQWRKYGQKVTRDNPCPRAYFKCSFAPSCPVKKKVQRSVEDQSVLVATYEGEHNHPHHSQMEETSAPCSAPTATLDLVKSKFGGESKIAKPKIESSPEVVPPILVEQMATSLTMDPNFRAALVAAISGRLVHKN